MYSNCLFWALGQARRHWRDGIAIGIESSRFGWWPHFYVIRRVDQIPDEFCESFNPPVKRKLPWWRLPVLFRGEVRRGKR